MTQGSKYGCHSDTAGPGPRGHTAVAWMQDGWTTDGRRKMKEVVTEWLPIRCGNTYPAAQGGCEGCENRQDLTTKGRD